MKHLPRVLLVVVLLSSLNALANSVNYTNLNVGLGIYPNYGLGDNVGGVLLGTNVNLDVYGGTETGWFNGGFPYGYSPGSVGAALPLFILISCLVAWAGRTTITSQLERLTSTPRLLHSPPMASSLWSQYRLPWD
jgi:hypothetical protein